MLKFGIRVQRVNIPAYRMVATTVLVWAMCLNSVRYIPESNSHQKNTRTMVGAYTLPGAEVQRTITYRYGYSCSDQWRLGMRNTSSLTWDEPNDVRGEQVPYESLVGKCSGKNTERKWREGPTLDLHLYEATESCLLQRHDQVRCRDLWISIIHGTVAPEMNVFWPRRTSAKPAEHDENINSDR